MIVVPNQLFVLEKSSLSASSLYGVYRPLFVTRASDSTSVLPELYAILHFQSKP